MIPASVRIFVCTRPHDMRCSYDTLALATQKILGLDPRSGALFVFTNKLHNRLKVLWWDLNGYCLLSKRLHQALFRLPADTGVGEPQDGMDSPRALPRGCQNCGMTRHDAAINPAQIAPTCENSAERRKGDGLSGGSVFRA
jgi:transposase